MAVKNYIFDSQSEKNTSNRSREHKCLFLKKKTEKD
jgi:hypothetical protein